MIKKFMDMISMFYYATVYWWMYRTEFAQNEVLKKRAKEALTTKKQCSTK